MSNTKNTNSKQEFEMLNKQEFVALLASSSNSTKVDAEKALNLVMEGILTAFKEGKGIALTGFGAFKAQKREARDGHNPKTGAAMKIPAYWQPSFKPGTKLKEACNNDG